MIKRLSVLLLTLFLVLSMHTRVHACDEEQTNTYVSQILFGDFYQRYSFKEQVKMLNYALYLCSEQQTGQQGQEKLNYLKRQKVSSLPSLRDIQTEHISVLKIVHNKWEYEDTQYKTIQEKRKKLLKSTINKIFDFGFFNNTFKNGGEKCNSFAALLYYSHILADYLADDPEKSKAYYKEKDIQIPSFAGKASIEINNDKPQFTQKQKQCRVSSVENNRLDSLGRAGMAYAVIGKDIMKSGDRKNMSNISPSGWNQKKMRYDFTENTYYYHRSHLIAHQLGGDEIKINLITGTYYLNEHGMKPLEKRIIKYIADKPNNHVLYRITPVYVGQNLMASGVQMEAYSVEDQGTGICFNRYCYNIQPGVNISYTNGSSRKLDITSDGKYIIPFASFNGRNTINLIDEMNNHLELLFRDQKNSEIYGTLQREIKGIFIKDKDIQGNESLSDYLSIKVYAYKYLEVLKKFVPELLKKESFFNSVFQ